MLAGIDEATLARFVARHLGDPRPSELRVRALRGGLESAGVSRVAARLAGEPGPRRTFTFVVKLLERGASREAAVYHALGAAVPAPMLLAEEAAGTGHLLYLELVRSRQRWPWRHPPASAAVMDTLAPLHAAVPPAAAEPRLPAWNYDDHLQERAAATARLVRTADEHALPGVRPSYPAVERVARDLPAIRARFMARPELPPCLVHGDVHPGNVLVAVRRSTPRLVLLDWGRARIGSPLEDVASWLQSLGHWEGEARRRHDTLLAAYLRARGLPAPPTRALRDAYWGAAASNALGGALTYHLAAAHPASGQPPARRRASLSAARDLLRVIRRADRCGRASRGAQPAGFADGSGPARCPRSS